ncbi:hypothetical protein [uncultured Mediterranean phage uvDeep-CGR2-KM21-C345]|nr:hypothetical protein [uncultured Mediterranean phage uvDeep-CGR2-KM21-C345]|tara:strand:+ start:1974 stop:2165 length:192 start_codon:yes stop_codon:yes gene_type:complete
MTKQEIQIVQSILDKLSTENIEKVYDDLLKYHKQFPEGDKNISELLEITQDISIERFELENDL